MLGRRRGRELRQRDQRELVDDANYASQGEANASLAEYSESFYNRVRRHSCLGYNSPIQFELKSQVATFAA